MQIVPDEVESLARRYIPDDEMAWSMNYRLYVSLTERSESKWISKWQRLGDRS